LSGTTKSPPRAGAGKRNLFIEDFDAVETLTVTAAADEAANEPEIIVPAFSPDDVEAARLSGYEAGVAAGRAMVQGAREAALDGMLAAIRAGLADAAAGARQRADDIGRELARLLVASLAAVLPDLVRRHGATEISRLVQELLPPMALEPEIVVRVAASDREALAADLGRLDAHLASRVRLVTEAGMSAGDVVIAWKNGRASRDGAALGRQLAELWQRFGLDADTHAEKELVDVE
jgi:flagellar biosynthesis/type III secretory pathway protein FliH